MAKLVEKQCKPLYKKGSSTDKVSYRLVSRR